jgi:hypothetical protein
MMFILFPIMVGDTLNRWVAIQECKQDGTIVSLFVVCVCWYIHDRNITVVFDEPCQLHQDVIISLRIFTVESKRDQVVDFLATLCIV